MSHNQAVFQSEVLINPEKIREKKVKERKKDRTYNQTIDQSGKYIKIVKQICPAISKILL